MDEERERKFLELLWSEQKEAGLSDFALSKELGVAHSTISRLKSSKRRVGLELLYRAAERFKAISLFLSDDLRTGTESSAVSYTAKAGAA